MTQTSEIEVGDNHSTKRRSADQPIIVQFQGAPPSGGGVTSQGPRAPRRQEWLRLTEEGDYSEHKILARVRYEDALNADLGSGDWWRLKGALRKIIVQHNGWINPDTDIELPPCSQPCRIDVEAERLLAEEATRYKAALKDAESNDKAARTAARAQAEFAHKERVKEIRDDADRQKMDQPESPCCFWDSCAQEEISLMMRAVGEKRKKYMASLIEMENNSTSG